MTRDDRAARRASAGNPSTGTGRGVNVPNQTPAGPIPRRNDDPPLEAVLFDAGLTLIRSTTPAHDVAREALAGHGVSATTPELELAMETAEAQIRAHWLSRDWWASDRLVRELFVSAYRSGLREVAAVGSDTELGARLADSVYDTYHQARHWSLYPDVLPTLRELRANGIRLGIISDWGHGLEAIVLELELGAYVEFVVVSSRLGVAKPDPSVFGLALDRIGVAPKQAVYVGDTYVKDVMGARAAGIFPVLLDREGSAPKMDCPTISTLTELLPMAGLASVQ